MIQESYATSFYYFGFANSLSQRWGDVIKIMDETTNGVFEQDKPLWASFASCHIYLATGNRPATVTSVYFHFQAA